MWGADGEVRTFGSSASMVMEAFKCKRCGFDRCNQLRACLNPLCLFKSDRIFWEGLVGDYWVEAYLLTQDSYVYSAGPRGRVHGATTDDNAKRLPLTLPITISADELEKIMLLI